MNESDLPTQAQPSSSSRREGSALLPGTVLAGRYRIVAPLGHGGMGVVYRAEDLKLGQAVALKFLPAGLRGDEARRKRLRDEVKLARLVAHPNVCRVWDVMEADGHEFLAMEYVDGEDLASLLRRIGRLPEERAVRMARELCAGLGAVHDQGILHRDLKPANVMVDGRGRVRLADFGLAAVAREIASGDIGSGTPAYMSPEQQEGREVTVRSDVYALGLVLYEVFTGQPAFVRTAEEAAKPGNHATPSSPSSHVKDLDPAIDRVIQRCLEPDPALRPASAMAVAASLPGGDPLAAALAAGETPSPELPAGSSDRPGLPRTPPRASDPVWSTRGDSSIECQRLSWRQPDDDAPPRLVRGLGRLRDPGDTRVRRMGVLRRARRSAAVQCARQRGLSGDLGRGIAFGTRIPVLTSVGSRARKPASGTSWQPPSQPARRLEDAA
jgi:serine/threonine-protein kinase